MHNEFTSVIERDGDWFIGYCPEIPGANGQGSDGIVTPRKNKLVTRLQRARPCRSRC
jgi:hypothetical protein